MPIARAHVARFTCAIPRLASPASHALHAKNVCQNSIMGQSYGPRRIFLLAFLILILSKYCHILGKTLCSGPWRRLGRQAHGDTGLAPRHHVRCPWDFLGLISTSKNEPCAKQLALLGVFSSRPSSVSRGVRSAVQIYFFMPSVIFKFV